MASLYSRYVRERTGGDVIEIDNVGFISFHQTSVADMFVDDLFVVPEHRRSRVAWGLADRVAERARVAGCTRLVAQVDTSAAGATEALLAHLAYGFRIIGTRGSLIFTAKEIANG